MELNVGDRVLVTFNDDKFGVKEDNVREMNGEWVRWDTYPHWRKIGTFSIIQKLPKKEPYKIRPQLTWSTEGLDCPLLKQKCNQGCAWYQHKSCILLQLADDINTAVNDDT